MPDLSPQGGDGYTASQHPWQDAVPMHLDSVRVGSGAAPREGGQSPGANLGAAPPGYLRPGLSGVWDLFTVPCLVERQPWRGSCGYG